jgi:hypothetical protein
VPTPWYQPSFQLCICFALHSLVVWTAPFFSAVRQVQTDRLACVLIDDCVMWVLCCFESAGIRVDAEQFSRSRLGYYTGEQYGRHTCLQAHDYVGREAHVYHT